MASLKPLSECCDALPPVVVAKAQQCGLHTVQDFLHLALPEGVSMFACPVQELRKWQRMLCELVTPKPASCLETLEKRKLSCLKTGIEELDDLLRGGIHAGQVVEIVGPAGAGKTQFCLMMAARAVVAGGTAVYIDTESRFTVTRLFDMISICLGIEKDDAGDSATVRQCASRCMVCDADSLDSVQQRLAATSSIFQPQEGCSGEEHDACKGIIILDSLAAPARLGGAANNIQARQRTLNSISATLKLMASRLRVPVVVSNQVVGAARADGGSWTQGSNSRSTAALGLVWSHAVNHRLVLERFAPSDAPMPVASWRNLWVAKSSSAPVVAVPTRLCDAGVAGRQASNSQAMDVKNGKNGKNGQGEGFRAPPNYYLAHLGDGHPP